MSIDINNNIATFTNDVVIDDQEMKIECNKMIVAFISDKENKNNKQIKHVECIGDVILTRKLTSEKDKQNGQQKATAGRAIYEMATGKIILKEKPVLYRGEDYIKGSLITIWRDSQKMSVDNATIVTSGALTE